MFKKYNHIHFIGIGGSGISALAYLALAEGKKVSGSDITDSETLDKLRQLGAEIFVAHAAKNVAHMTDLVIYSEAIDVANNPEFQEVKKRNLFSLTYFQALGELSHMKQSIVVVGTHGKTTTTAMLGTALVESNIDPTVIVGSSVSHFQGRNIYIGKSNWLVVEGCEYRRSFLSLSPFGVVFLNCEAEHLDYYHDEKDYMDAFIELIKKIPSEGFVVANMDDANVRQIVQYCQGQVIPVNTKIVEDFDLNLSIPGDFNQFNATQAYLAAEYIGAEPNTIRKALKSFKNTARRMEIKGDVNGITVIDDYAHHPTEIQATLGALKEKYPDKRLICVFQPHQHSRTYYFLNEFKESFYDADVVIIPNIYATRDSEEDKAKINAEQFVQTLAEKHPQIIWGKDFNNTLNILKTEARSGDLIVTMGAGDVNKIAELLLMN